MSDVDARAQDDPGSRSPRRDDDQLRRLFDRVGAGIAVASTDGELRYVNPRFCTAVRSTPEQLVGSSFIELTHPDDRPRNLELIADLLAGDRDSFTLDKRYLRPDGTPVWVRANVATYRTDDGELLLIATTENITEQKRVEARLEQSQALLRIAGEVGRVGGWAIDADPVRLYWSDEVHDLAGYPRGQTPPLDEALDLYPQPSQDAMAACVDRCLADGTPFDLEARFRPRGRDEHWVRVVGEAVWDDQGAEVVRIQGAILDISDQKRAQEESQELAERLTATMESITDALYTVDTRWRFTYINARAQQVLERDATGLIGRTIWDEFPAIVGSELERTYRRAARTGETMVLEEYHYPPLERYFTVHAYPSDQGLAVYFRDVTDDRETRLELEERGARLAEQAALLDEAQDAIVVRDLDGRITFWNRSAERIYGWSAQEAIGRSVDELLAIDPAVYAQGMEQLFAHGSWVSEITERDRTGRELTVEARWTLVADERRERSIILGIDTDITQRKQIELQFLRSQRMESIGKLAGGIAHDLNNSLAPIQISIDMLRDDETDPERLRILDLIDTSARRGADMVEQVLSFARGVGGNREPIAVGAIVDEVRRICADTFPKNITIDAEVPPELWQVIGDATQIQQVLMNLSVNARDAMPDGGTLTLAAENETTGGAVDIGGGAAVLLRVSDTGTGIAEDITPRIFDPFFSTKPASEGTGLGLSTSAVIIESHGGRIDVATVPARGTTFRVRLPADTGAPDDTPSVPGATPYGAGELILVVDDEPAILSMCRVMLERAGYEVATASDGAEAIARLDEHDRVALIVTDLMMPGMDGFALIEKVRQRHPDLPIVATSGLYAASSVDRALDAGADRFLAKPFDRERLLATMGATLATADDER